MNYSKLAAVGVRIFALYMIFCGLADVIYVLYKTRVGASFDSGYYGLMICYRFFIGLLLMRLSIPLGRKLVKDITEDSDPSP